VRQGLCGRRPKRETCGTPPGRGYISSMACRISELGLECRDPEGLARFWCDVLDFVVLDREDDVLVEIGPRQGFGGLQPTIVLVRTENPRPGKSRLHVDVNATDRDQEAELERLLELGARPADIGQTGEESWHVLADPEGNEFCLLKRRLDPL
jgi:catechol 2,3-dioxygenase-like lactoylglutathione lyase family enzyme